MLRQQHLLVLQVVDMRLVQLALLSVKAVKASMSFLKARCVKAWRVTRVVLAALLSSQILEFLERQAKVAELQLPHQSTCATPWNVSTALIM